MLFMRRQKAMTSSALMFSGFLNEIPSPKRGKFVAPYTTSIGHQQKRRSAVMNNSGFTFFLQNMIDGAAFLGVGFDGRGDYSPESRKMSIVQRNCKNKAT